MTRTRPLCPRKENVEHDGRKGGVRVQYGHRLRPLIFGNSQVNRPSRESEFWVPVRATHTTSKANKTRAPAGVTRRG